LDAGREGAKKLRLLSSPWSTDNLPPASATLLSVAPRRGLLAAASPDKLVIASTEKVRKAFQEKAGKNDIVADFSPDATLPVPQLRHVAFSTDEDFLVTSAEHGGGLSVYSVDDLLKGNTQPGVQIATDNTSVRALLPNPAPEQAHYMAIVLDSGRLDITDITKGNAKTVHSEGVTCASWSQKGKAIVAGLEDGTASIHLVSSLDQVKGKIPRPPGIDENFMGKYPLWQSPSAVNTNLNSVGGELAEQR
jgi:nucleoporin NUP159